MISASGRQLPTNVMCVTLEALTRYTFYMDQTTPSSSRTKLIYGGIAVVAVLILGGLFFGKKMNPLESAYLAPAYLAPAGVDVDQNRDGSTTYTNEEGSVTVGQGTSMPENWPKDAPVAYSGATIIYSGSTNPATGASGSAVSYTATASLKAVLDYYAAELRANGWTVDSNTEMAGMRVIAATKDTRTFGAYIAESGQGMVSVTAGIEL